MSMYPLPVGTEGTVDRFKRKAPPVWGSCEALALAGSVVLWVYR
jgi:hypothetical protein